MTDRDRPGTVTIPADMAARIASYVLGRFVASSAAERAHWASLLRGEAGTCEDRDGPLRRALAQEEG